MIWFGWRRRIMAQILILTKNVEHELALFEQLRHLGHEVFLSHNAVDYFEKKESFPWWVEGFSITIISETLSNKTAERILRVLKNRKHYCLLKVDVLPNVEQKETWIRQGFDGWIDEHSSLSETNELLEEIENSIPERRSDHFLTGEKEGQKSLELLQSKLSTVNKKIFTALMQYKGKNISREELSILLWGKCTDATLSQLSVRIKKMNLLIYSQLGIDQAIVTDWGKGYRFKELFVETCL